MPPRAPKHRSSTPCAKHHANTEDDTKMGIATIKQQPTDNHTAHIYRHHRLPGGLSSPTPPCTFPFPSSFSLNSALTLSTLLTAFSSLSNRPIFSLSLRSSISTLSSSFALALRSSATISFAWLNSCTLNSSISLSTVCTRASAFARSARSRSSSFNRV
jgi:hypothetical protein